MPGSGGGPDFEGAYRRTVDKNYARFDPASSMDRIRSFARLAGVPEARIMRKITTDKVFRWAFIKDPKKQNIYEGEAARWLRGLSAVADFRRHRAPKPVVHGGMVLRAPGPAGRGRAALASAVDFSWRTNSCTVHAAHTYTHYSGGMQGNRYDILHYFISEANKSSDARRIFIAIADGAFYGTADASRGQTRIEALRASANGRTVFAGRSVDVPGILSGLP